MQAVYDRVQQRAAAAAAAAKEANIGAGDYTLSLKNVDTAGIGEWFNDVIINLAFRRVLIGAVELLQQGHGVPVHIYHTIFMDKLWLQNPSGGVNYAAVRRHTFPKALQKAGQQRSSVKDCRYLIAPCHLPIHWVLVVADLQERTIMYLDPFGVSTKDWAACMSVGCALQFAYR
jgi:sentrin-specific protease 2 (axin associating molecule)